jgi:hypothetical protein
LAAAVLLAFLVLQLAVLVLIQFCPLLLLLAAAVEELKMAMALLAAQVVAVGEMETAQQEPQIKDLRVGMVRLAGQSEAALVAAVLDKLEQTRHQMLEVMVVMVLLQPLQAHR